MNLQMNFRLANAYKSKSQIARILTEEWLAHYLACPNCGHYPLKKFKNNQPVADFYCDDCHEEFELKSKRGKIQNSIMDGAYASMLSRVQDDNNPNFFFLGYSEQWMVNNLLIIPKHFFTPDIIIRRPPLPPTAKRAGWTGCSIDISKVPETGKIYWVRNGRVRRMEEVRQDFSKALFLREKPQSSRGWILDVMYCVDAIKKELFSLSDIYQFESQLAKKYPYNRFVKDKIRQQLQLLRDQGMIEFLGCGIYRKKGSIA